MIKIEEISIENVDDFWQEQYEYLTQDGIIIDDEEKEYFQSDDYRQVIIDHMKRNVDTHHLVYFVQDNKRIGAASYCIYQSEDGKCFILDFWVFPEFRGKGTGHRCFDVLREYTSQNGAVYYELNCDGRDDRMRFWKSNGFIEIGVDEYGVPLLSMH